MASVRNPRKVHITNISREANEVDLKRLFEVCGRIMSLEYKGDFGFIEFEDVSQSDEAIRRFHGTDFMGKRIVVEPYVYRGGDFRYRPAAAPNPIKFRARNVNYRLYLTGLDNSTSWQDVKDFARIGGRSVCYTDVYTKHGKKEGLIEYFERDDYERALHALEGARLNDAKVSVYTEHDYQKKRNRESSRSHSRDRSRTNNDHNNYNSHRKKRSNSRRSRSRHSRSRHSRSNNRKSSPRQRDRDNIKRSDNDNDNKRSRSHHRQNFNNNDNSNNSRNEKNKYSRYSTSRSPNPKRNSSTHNDRKINHPRSPRVEKKDSTSRSPKQSQQQRDNTRSKFKISRSPSHNHDVDRNYDQRDRDRDRNRDYDKDRDRYNRDYNHDSKH